MNDYSHFKISKSEAGEYCITPLREKDIFKIKEWRNAQMDFLRQKSPLTDKEQEDYYRKVIKPEFSHPAPSQILFSFLKNGECIGYGGITNIDWESKRTELSFLLNNKRAWVNSVYDKEFSIFLSLIKQLVFEKLQFNRIFTETFDIRPFHISILEKNGFIPEGRMHQHVFLKGKFVDSLIHGFTKEQYAAEK